MMLQILPRRPPAIDSKFHVQSLLVLYTALIDPLRAQLHPHVSDGLAAQYARIYMLMCAGV